MAITALVVVPVALCGRNARRAAVALAALAVGSLPWLIPSVLHPVYADPAGVAAFASRADTPFGTVGSLLMLGGAWNAQTVPKAYGGPWSALWLAVVIAAIAGYAATARRGATVDPREHDAPAAASPRGRWPGLGPAAVAGLLIASIGITAAGRDLLANATRVWPGFAVLRDGQQFVAPLALVEALGLGLAVTWAKQAGSFGIKKEEQPVTDRPGLALGIIAVLAPVLLLPGLVAGAAGRLRPAWYPPGWLAAARAIDADPGRGDVLLLPWASYRTPSWNHGEVILDPWPRLLSRPVIWNDGTRVGNVTMAPDDPRARRLDGIINSAKPLTAALRAAGVRFVVVDVGQPGSAATARERLPGCPVVISQPGLVVYRIPS